MQVVTEKLELPPLTLQNPDGKRLMTVDIGTTTIAMQLYDMTGKVVDSFPSVNPQVSYGADVLSRIEAAKNPGKAADMQKKSVTSWKRSAAFFQKAAAAGDSADGRCGKYHHDLSVHGLESGGTGQSTFYSQS